MIAIDADSMGTKKIAFEGMAVEFGTSALLPKKQGGINTQAFKEGTTSEGQEAAANKCGLGKSQGIALCAVIKAINEVRPTMYQDFQIAYFGLETIKPQSVKEKAAPTEAQLRIAAIGVERRDINEQKTANGKKLKVAKAEMTLAKANNDKAAEDEAAIQVSHLEKIRNGFTAEADELKDEADELRAERKAGPLLDSTQALLEKLNKSKVLFGNANDMTLGDIIDQLGTLAANS